MKVNPEKIRKHLNLTPQRRNPIEAEATIKETTAIVPWKAPSFSTPQAQTPPPPSRAWMHLSKRDEENVNENDDDFDDDDYDEEPRGNIEDSTGISLKNIDFKTLTIAAIGFSFARMLSLNLALPPPLVAGVLLVATWQGTREGRFAQYRTPILIGTALALIETVLPLKIKRK